MILSGSLINWIRTASNNTAIIFDLTSSSHPAIEEALHQTKLGGPKELAFG